MKKWIASFLIFICSLNIFFNGDGDYTPHAPINAESSLTLNSSHENGFPLTNLQIGSNNHDQSRENSHSHDCHLGHCSFLFSVPEGFGRPIILDESKLIFVRTFLPDVLLPALIEPPVA